MFNWVCPRCGKDVPPSKTECPYCPAPAQEPVVPAPPQASTPQYQPVQPPQAQQFPPQQYSPETPPQHAPESNRGWQPPPPPPSWQPPPPPPPASQAWGQPPQSHTPPQQQHQPPPQQPQQWQPPANQPHPHQAWAPPPNRAAQPTWLIGIGFAVAFIAVFAAIYFAIQHFGHTNVQEKAGLENPSNASQQKVSNPLQKYVEVVGIRLISENKKPAARFVVVNHSNTDIAGLEASVTLWASTSRSEEDSIGSFNLKLANLPANSSKELTEPLKTKLKQYELPDWQNATAEIQITSPRP
jgi:hypothetical protein